MGASKRRAPRDLPAILSFRSKSGMARPLLLIAVAIFALTQAGPALADIAYDLQAGAYILMDADTGQILLEKDMHAVHKPASITKIMTALLALEKGPAGDPVTVSATAVAANPGDGSSAGLMPGEIIPLDEILYAVMLESANEAANAVAEYVSGTMGEFAQLMTRRAKELGAENTNFANPSGLNDDNHYTSAYDMAMITREAVKNRRFQTIWSTYRHYLEPTNLQPERRILNNKNRMLTQGSMPYQGIMGGKTGYTVASLNTLVETARRDGRTLICVLLQGPGALSNYRDAARLLDYGFDQFRPIAYENEEFGTTFTYLLHNNLHADEVRIVCGQTVENEDGSTAAYVTIEAPENAGSLMYPAIAGFTLTSPAPTPADDLVSGAGGGASSSKHAPVRLLAGLFSLIAEFFHWLMAFIDLLPRWLALIVKIILGLFAALCAAACFFRTRRWIRRRRRMIRKRRQEARRKAYREQQTYWS